MIFGIKKIPDFLSRKTTFCKMASTKTNKIKKRTTLLLFGFSQQKIGKFFFLLQFSFSYIKTVGKIYISSNGNFFIYFWGFQTQCPSIPSRPVPTYAFHHVNSSKGPKKALIRIVTYASMVPKVHLG